MSCSIFCYACDRNSVIPAGTFLCPGCQSDFIEVLEGVPQSQPVQVHGNGSDEARTSTRGGTHHDGNEQAEEVEQQANGGRGSGRRIPPAYHHMNPLPPPQPRVEMEDESDLPHVMVMEPFLAMMREMLLPEAPETSGNAPNSANRAATNANANRPSNPQNSQAPRNPPNAPPPQNSQNPPNAPNAQTSQHSFFADNPFMRMFDIFGTMPFQMMGPNGAMMGPDPQVFQRILAQSMADANRFGTPPASESALRNLKRLHPAEVPPGTDCHVCMDAIHASPGAPSSPSANASSTGQTEDDRAVKMPCGHFFHEKCLIPWLRDHSSCPSCRLEIESEDPAYEDRKRRQRQEEQIRRQGGPSYFS